jgi:hypothetical protein
LLRGIKPCVALNSVVTTMKLLKPKKWYSESCTTFLISLTLSVEIIIALKADAFKGYY